MARARDEFTKAVADIMAKSAAYICSNPDCRANTIAPSNSDLSKFIYIGKAAHICAAAEGGPRYVASMTPEERSSIDNGIYLCSNCADMIDKNGGVDHSPDLLKEWRSSHHEWIKANFNKNSSNESRGTVINVTSNNQQGGITAGIVNLKPKPRSLDRSTLENLLGVFLDRDRMLLIEANAFDPKASRFA